MLSTSTLSRSSRFTRRTVSGLIPASSAICLADLMPRPRQTIRSIRSSISGSSFRANSFVISPPLVHYTRKRPPVFRRGPFLPCLLLREIRQSLHLLGSRPRTAVDVLTLALKVVQNPARTVQHVRRDATDAEHTLERPPGDRNLLLPRGVLLGLHRVLVLNLLNVLLAERVVASLPVVNSTKTHFVLLGLICSVFSGAPARCGASVKGHSGVRSIHRVGCPAALPRIRSIASREDTDVPTDVPPLPD